MATFSIQADPTDPLSAMALGGQVGDVPLRAATLVYEHTKVNRKQAVQLFKKMRLRVIQLLSEQSH